MNNKCLHGARKLNFDSTPKMMDEILSIDYIVNLRGWLNCSCFQKLLRSLSKISGVPEFPIYFLPRKTSLFYSHDFRQIMVDNEKNMSNFK